jgi:hypothetical protein
MVEIAVFALVLIAVFAAKAASIVFMADDAIEKSASFSWVKPGVADEAVSAWDVEPEPARSVVPVRVYAHRRPKAA